MDINVNESVPHTSSRHPTDLAELNTTFNGTDDSPISPQTPSSMFSSTLIRESKGCIIHSMLLSYWDNILGPRIRHLWQTDSTTNLVSKETLPFIASHTLSGEICRDPSDSHVDTKFYVVKERGVVVTAFVFGAMGRGDLGVHSLSLLVSHSDLKRYLHWQDMCKLWISRDVAKLRVMLEKEMDDTALASFTPYLHDFIQMLKSLRESGLPQHIPLCDTAFHPQHHFNGPFLGRAIMTHLITCGRSVVIGQSPGRINLMVATLAMFLSPTEKYCCRYVTADEPQTYAPDLCVQGIIQDSDAPFPMVLHNIYASQYPTALIDLRTEEVKYSSLPHEHYRKWHETLKQELISLWQGQDTQGYYNGELFYTYDDPETLIKNFVDALLLLPLSDGVCESFVEQFTYLLHRKALALIKYVETESKQSKVSMRNNIKKLKHDLSLTVPGDFHIILATAEKLKPGISGFLLSDPKQDAEYRQTVMNVY